MAAASVTDARLHSLFSDAEKSLSATGIGAERWYLVILACLIAGPTPSTAGQLYTYLTSQPAYQTPSERQHLIRRIREALIKLFSIVGAPKPIEAIMAINKLELPQDKDDTPPTREGWTLTPESDAVGDAWLGKLYAGDKRDILDLFRDHKDFEWVSTHITYGLFLGDRQVLDDWDTELVVMPGIMAQNMEFTTGWHIRGAKRIGVSDGDCRVICGVVHRVMGNFGVRLDRVPDPDTINK